MSTKKTLVIDHPTLSMMNWLAPPFFAPLRLGKLESQTLLRHRLEDHLRVLTHLLGVRRVGLTRLAVGKTYGRNLWIWLINLFIY